MRTLKVMEHMSLDGVIQQTPDGGEFRYTEWTVPYRSPAGRELLQGMQGMEIDLLLGRRTYDLWSGHWPKMPSGPMADCLNGATKYVVTHRPEDLAWGPAVAVGPDVVEAVRGLKAEDGRELVVWGSSTLTSALMEAGLVDEVVLVVYPVLLGEGKRFFAEGTPGCGLEMVSTQGTATGVMVNRYRVVGRLTAG